MRHFFLCILAACLLTSLGTPGFSEKPLRLFFEKDTTANPTQTKEYTVKDGDCLFNILVKNGYTSAEIRRILPSIQQNNPQVQNMDKLLPGQKLFIPKPRTQKDQNKEHEQKKKEHEPSSSIQKPYIVHSGDTLLSMMQQYGIPRNLIFSKYMPIFRKLNPDIRDVDNLREGQRVILPMPQPSDLVFSNNATSGHAPSSGLSMNATASGSQGEAGEVDTNWNASSLAQISTAMPIPTTSTFPGTPGPALPPTTLEGQEPSPTESRHPTTGLPYVRNMLEEMRFSFAPGDEELYPLANGEWLQVKLDETPLLTTPWGEKVILCPTPKNSEWIDKAARLGMQVCPVSSDWSFPDILKALSEKFPDQIRIWNPGQELSMSRNGLGLTVRTPHTVIIQHRGEKRVHAFWSRHDSNEPALPQGLSEVLQDMRVKLIETDQFNEVTRLPTRPRQSIYVPVAERTELIRALNPNEPEELFGPTLPGDLDTLLRLLKSRDMLREGFANLTWSGGEDRRIALQVPTWIVGPASSKVILLDRRFADEYLISLLAHEGYSCFVLPD